MPDSVEAMTLTQSLQLRAADPELYEVLAGRMDAGTEAAILAGRWPDAVPSVDPELIRHQRIQEITQGSNPFHPETLNRTAQLRLEAEAPDVAMAQREAAAPFVAVQQQNAATAAAQREQQLREGAAEHANYAAQDAARQRISSMGRA